MRTFLRHIATGQYFQSLEKWTPDREEAYDFGVLSRAMKVARKMRIPDLELVLWADGPDPAAATPFEKFLLGLKRKGHVTGRRAPRSWRTAVNI